MNASLNEKLRNVKWGEFKFNEVFNNIKQGRRLKKDDQRAGNVPFVMAGTTNNGVVGFISNPVASFSKNSITIDIFGNTFYRGYAFGAGDDTGVYWNDSVDYSPNTMLFFTAVMQRSLHGKFSYGKKFRSSQSDDFIMQLPVTNAGEIDFDFMNLFIAELEAERVAELEAERVAELSAYFTVSGLDNYELSIEEKRAIDDYSHYSWGTYNLKTLFGKSTRGKRLKSEDRIPGNLPFITAGEADEGVSAFIGNPVEVFEKNTTTIDMFGSAKYRNYRYGGDDHIAIVHTEKIPMKASIFVTSACHKAAHTGKFDYGHNFYAKDADALNIMLPEKNGKPDYQSMELLISAIQKIVIKDVVQYTDRKIAAADKIVKGDKQNDGVSPAGQVPDMEQQSSNLIYLPIVGEIAAGHEHFAEDDILGEIGVEPSRLHPKTPGKHFFLRVSGDSMIGAGIYDGDNVLIRRMSNPRADVRNGDVVACQIHGENATLKTFYREHDHVRLKPENEEYEEYIIPNIDFETGEARIIGKCMGIWPGDEAWRMGTEVSGSIIKKDVFSFIIYIIHACANEWRTTPKKVYKALKSSDCIRGYLVPHYDILHTQGTDYLVDDIHRYLELRGVTV